MYTSAIASRLGAITVSRLANAFHFFKMSIKLLLRGQKYYLATVLIEARSIYQNSVD